ncbi:MAG: hypothetical protein EOQ56_23435 [Mesorhizobium sp.]|nr:MAG: hypothetical protein EOQ56_23435 [Mesorhizobium sp.]
MAASAALAMTGCSQTSKLIGVSGHPYMTEPNCHRTEPFGEFDETCDEPRLGFKNFSPPPVAGGF